MNQMASLGFLKYLCIGALTIVCIQMIGFPMAATGQSFAPGTGRYWKRNPTPSARFSQSLAHSSEEIANISRTMDQTSRAALEMSAQAERSANDLAAAQAAATQAKARADAMAQELAVKAQSVIIATEQAALAGKRVQDLTEQLAGGKGPAALSKSARAMQEQLNAGLAEETSASEALNAAKFQLEQANDVLFVARADASKASQHEAELEVTAAGARTAATEAQAAADRAKQNLAGAKATPAVITSPKGGFGFSQLSVTVTSCSDGLATSIQKLGNTDSTNDFKVEQTCRKDGSESNWHIMVAFHPSGTDAEQVTLVYGTMTVDLSGQVDAAPDTTAVPQQQFFPLNRHPAVPDDPYGLGQKLEADFGIMLDVSNAFWSQEASLSYLNQTQYFFNTGSSSSTLKADVASMVFPGGTQLTLATNISVGTSNSTPKSGAQTAVFARTGATAASPPSMTSDQATQAAQNLVDGGNLLLRASWPLYWYEPKYLNFEVSSLVVGRDGLDIPNFNGANTVATDPINHFNISNEWYLQFDALPAKQGGDSQGSVFLDAKYGFDYVSTEFAHQAGFVHNWNKGFLGQITGGLVFSGKLDIVASRNFGPDQTWTDSTSGATVTKNNFRSWSVGVKYATNQSK